MAESSTDAESVHRKIPIMLKLKFPRSIAPACAGLLAISALSGWVAAEDAEGVVRLQNAPPAGIVRVSSSLDTTVTRGQSPAGQIRPVNGEVVYTQNCPPEGMYFDFDPDYACDYKSAFDQWLTGQCYTHRARQRHASRTLQDNLHADCREKAAWARCKFGYFIPTGNCGKGTPPFGHYSMVYPVNPQHFDARDGQVYAAQGYAGPVSVPLAPVVNHTYNYGWGVPSSRLTPVSHPVSPAQANAFQSNQMAIQPQVP